MADLAELTQFLKPRRGDLDKPASIRIKADQRLKYSRVIDVVDACNQAGFKQVGFAAPDW
jgi:biopolymer transport protein ExbD